MTFEVQHPVAMIVLILSSFVGYSLLLIFIIKNADRRERKNKLEEEVKELPLWHSK